VRARAALGALTAVALIRVLRRYVVVTVRGPSMAPTYGDGDRVLALRTAPHRLVVGDVVVSRLPGLAVDEARGPRDRPWVIKRVAAVTGDPVPGAPAELVPPARLYLVGDNPDGGLDSRVFGLVHTDLVLGRVVRRLVPGDEPPP
jgi:signal peptidase I